MNHSADRNTLTDQRIDRRKTLKRISIPVACTVLTVALGEILRFDLIDVVKQSWGGTSEFFKQFDVLDKLNKLGVFTLGDTIGIDFARIERILANALAGATFGIALNLSLNKVGLFDRCFPDPPSFVFCDLARERAETLLEVELGAPPALVGRDSEMHDLCAMLAPPAQERFLVQVVNGATGCGKSRLAIEWLAQAAAKKWDFGIIDPSRVDRVKTWKARRPTALVLDEADTPGLMQQVGSVHPLEALLLGLLRASSSERPIRILLVGQSAPWILEQAPEKLRPYVVKQSLELAPMEGAPLQQLAMALATETGANPATIVRESAGIPRHAILLAQAPDATTLESALNDWVNRAIPSLAREGHAVDRSLAFGLVSAAMIGPVATGSVTQHFPDLDVGPLLRFFPRSGRSNLEEEIPALRPNGWSQVLALRLLDRLPQGLREGALVPLLLKHPEPLERRLGEIWRDHSHWVEDHCDHPAQKTWQADLVGRLRSLQSAFDARWPERVEVLHTKVASALATLKSEDTEPADGIHAASMVKAIAEVRPFDGEVRMQEAAAAVGAIRFYGTAAREADNPNSRRATLAALECWGDRLDALLAIGRLAVHPDLRLSEFKATVNAINHYGKAGAAAGDAAVRAASFAALEHWGRRFDAMIESQAAGMEALRGDPAIRLREVMAAVNAINYYGEAGAAASDATERASSFAALERWGKRIDAILVDDVLGIDAFRCDPAIRLHEAMAAVNAINHYGKAGAAADDATARLACFSALERWGLRFDAMLVDDVMGIETLRADPAIRLHEAIAVVNAICYYGEAGATASDAAQVASFAALERWGQRLDAMLVDEDTRIDALRFDPAIRKHEALAAVNAISHFGDAAAAASGSVERAACFSALERWGQRLDAMLVDDATRIDALRSDPAIRLNEAKAAVNAINSYGKVSAALGDSAERAACFSAVERWGQRFDAMLVDEATRIDMLRSDPAIRLEEAKAAVNTINNYGIVGSLADDATARAVSFAALERWGKRFDDMLIDEETRIDALRSDPAIRMHEAMAAINAIKHYGNVAWAAGGATTRAANFAALERWGQRLDAMLVDTETRIDALCTDPSIRLQEAKAAFNAINIYSKVGDTKNFRRWCKKLALVAQQFPNHSEIAGFAHKQNLSVADQRSQGWPFGRYIWSNDGERQRREGPTAQSVAN